ncbi:MAG: hypothetical protein JNK45_23800 [Myxococcales bacterium]|nr:hypothetical protein [Myxococcales bacterium]
MSDLEIHLSDVHVAHGELRVPYALSNHTAAPVYVYNLVPDRFGQLAGRPDPTPTARLAQTCFDRDHLVMFVLAEIPRPRRVPEPSYFAPAKPAASRIDAGAGFQATIRARLPLVEWSEIWVPQPQDPTLVMTPVHTLQLVVDWVHEADIIAADESPAYTGCFAISDRLRHRALAEADVRAIGIEIAVHPHAPRLV